MPADARARPILGDEHVWKCFRLQFRKRRRTLSQRQKELGNLIGLPQLRAREVVLPAKRHDAPFACVTVKLELAKGKCTEGRDEGGFRSESHRLAAASRSRSRTSSQTTRRAVCLCNRETRTREREVY